MHNKISYLKVIFSISLCMFFSVPLAAEVVYESARDIPLIHDVDVVVVGGTSGGVTAAVEAAGSGAKVFLAAPRTYLGEDLCATYRLWLEPGETPDTPLGRRLFALPDLSPPGRGVPYTYQADQPSAGVHKDTSPPSLLRDGKWSSAPAQSVQYDGSVNLVLDLGKEISLGKVRILAYQRPNDFEVEKVTVFSSPDRKNWKEISTVNNKKITAGTFEENAFAISIPLAEKIRYLKLFVQKTERVERILLAEVIVEAQLDKPETPPAPTVRTVPPMQIKHTLDQALLAAKVPFLFGCFTTDILQDAEGHPAGIVMTNRSGRQAVRAKVIIDATARATVARLAGAQFKPYPVGSQIFKRVVVAERSRSGVALHTRSIPTSIPFSSGVGYYSATEYTLSLRMPEGSFASFAKAEQMARDLTWVHGQVDSSEELFQVPPDPMRARRSLDGPWPGAAEIDLKAFRPVGLEAVYVLGGCADLSRTAAEKLLRPLEYMRLGTRIGRAAAVEARRRPVLQEVHVASIKAIGSRSGQVSEIDPGFLPRHRHLPKISSPTRSLPVVGKYDVVVVGGGTAGAPAGIAAARQGAKTLVVEYLYSLGGVGTVGLINKYYHGNRVGFTSEIDKGLTTLTGAGPTRSGFDVEGKIEWYRRELRKAGADLWYGALGAAVVMEGRQVKGVVVAHGHGRGVVLAHTVIDSTGNADMAAAAGANCRYIGGSHIAVQGTGLPPRAAGAGYTNTDYTFVEDADILDMWRVYVLGRDKYKGAYDLGQLIDTRERRQIEGDFFLSPLDIYNQRTFPDTVVICKSNFDSHGFTVHPVFMIRPPDRAGMVAHLPYRCLLPRNVEGILVTGLAVSAHRDAIPVIRMQPDVQNQGYVVGVAAALAAQKNIMPRQIDIKQLQTHLIGIGNLPESVLTDTYTLVPREKIVRAVRGVVNNYDQLEILLDQPEVAMPLLREAYQTSDSEEHRCLYAHILGMFGDPTGAAALIRAVNKMPWDKGWRFTGMGQFGTTLSPLDSYLIALGRTRDKHALKPILEKAGRLQPDSEFSHFRAVAIALESLGDPAAASVLADLLRKPGMTGHAYIDISRVMEQLPGSHTDNSTRNHSLSELVLARALYRCGDHEGLGEKILNEYARDLRGPYSRHAHAVLQKK